MPELPEVYTICQQLERTVLDRKIEDVVISDGRLIKGMPPASFKAKVKGKVIKGVLRRGKVISLVLGEKLFLVLHLRISGWLLLSGGIEKHSRVGFVLDNKKILNFCDGRLLGEIKLVSDWQGLPLVKKMGPEPLTLKKDEFVRLFSGRKGNVKQLLMDQKFLAGIGNIYAQEALFCARVSPRRAADKIEKKELEKIYTCLMAILKKAIDKKGTSADTYRQTTGEDGGYVPLLKVYQRAGQPCRVCKAPIDRKTIGGRGTYFCAHCQK